MRFGERMITLLCCTCSTGGDIAHAWRGRFFCVIRQYKNFRGGRMKRVQVHERFLQLRCRLWYGNNDGDGMRHERMVALSEH